MAPVVPAIAMELKPALPMPAAYFFRLALIVGLALVQRAASHEHHDDKIPEGEAISPDPIVCSRLYKLLAPLMHC